MAHPVTYLKIVKNSPIVLGGHPVGFASIIPHDNGVFGVVVYSRIIISGVMAASFLFGGFFSHHAVPGFASFSGDDGIESDRQKHPADAKPDEQRLRVLHLAAGFAVDIEADDGGDSQYHGKNSRPAVGVFKIPGEGRVMNALGVAHPPSVGGRLSVALPI